MDRRQQKTRQAVFDAFIGLLEKRAYAGITVQQIIDRADIGRSTFYQHFGTKDELLETLCTDIFEHVFSEEPRRESTHDFSRGRRNLRDEITHILYHLRDNGAAIRRLLSGGSGEVFMRSFKEYLTKVFAGELKNAVPGIPRDYLLNHLVCDFAETVRWWMHNEQYSPEEISGFFLGTTPFLE